MLYFLRGNKMENRYCKLQGSNKIYLIEKYSNNNVIISCGNMKVSTAVDNITLLPENFIPPKRNIISTISVSSQNIPNEIMLRHKVKEVAISELDKYIDQAVIAKLGRVKIIHGRHGGVLREAVHEYLRNHQYVKEFYLAGYGEGGLGVTIAILGRKN